jgi:hypothetical protein
MAMVVQFLWVGNCNLLQLQCYCNSNTGAVTGYSSLNSIEALPCLKQGRC